MKTVLAELRKRAETWPAYAQAAFLERASEIERRLSRATYVASQAELDAIDEADRSGIAPAEEVEAAFTRFRSDGGRR
jgi:hypothetical protein